jgi:hypothetical protein
MFKILGGERPASRIEGIMGARACHSMANHSRTSELLVDDIRQNEYTRIVYIKCDLFDVVATPIVERRADVKTCHTISSSLRTPSLYYTMQGRVFRYINSRLVRYPEFRSDERTDSEDRKEDFHIAYVRKLEARRNTGDYNSLSLL